MGATAKVSITINGRGTELEVEPHMSLNELLRERLGLTGTKKGCDTGGCGSCTVLVDGRAVYSCMTYAMQVVGKEVLTIEGLQEEAGLSPIQRAFVEKGGLQCGFCTPGFLMSAHALLLSNASPTESQIRDALVGNICRCTGYVKILESVRAAALLLASHEPASGHVEGRNKSGHGYTKEAKSFGRQPLG